MIMLWMATNAWAWPDDAEWVEVLQDAAPMEDVGGEPTFGYQDLYGDSTEPLAFWFADETELFLRLQIADDPFAISPTLLQANVWGFLIDTDTDVTSWEYAIVSNGSTGQLQSFRNAAPDGTAGNASVSIIADYDGLEEDVVRVTNGTYWSVDLRIQRADLLVDLEIGDSDPFRLAVVSGPSTATSWSDVGACDPDSEDCEDFSAVVSDEMYIDGDLDGLTDAAEELIGSSPADGDTDDDGVLDGDEDPDDADEDGAAGWADCDSDDDNLLDGLELGTTVALLDTDETAGCFLIDADPDTQTDPLDSDSDGGGLSDGDEDWNGDGKIDVWETDPNNADDDVDLDADGIPDSVDGEGDADENGVPNYQDDDSDGDGVPDAVEWLDDSDEDGIPDFLDDDDDNDGIPTSLEDSDGDGDPSNDDIDGDGLANHLDDDADGDGIPDSEEAGDDPEDPVDTDSDGLFDFLDEDSDDDGVADADEDPDGDVDCDGIPDRLDLDDTDSSCDTALPGDTGETGVNLPDVDTAALEPLPVETGIYFAGGVYTGGACSSAPVAASWPALSGLLALLWRRRRRLAATGTAPKKAVTPYRFGAGSVLLALALPANAQEIDAERFSASVDGLRFVKLEDSAVARAGAFGASAGFSYADDPLVFRSADPDIEQLRLLGSVATTEFSAFYSLGILRLGLGLPLHVTTGDGVVRPTQLGDVRLSSKATLKERSKGPLGFGVFVDVTAPSSSSTSRVGAGMTRMTAGVAPTAEFGPLLVAANASFRTGTGRDLGALAIGPSIGWGAGASFAVTDAVWASVELEGEQWLSNAEVEGSAPVEILGALRMRPIGDLVGTLGGGAGLSRGVGAPDFRLIAGLGWTPGPDETQVITAVGPDRDGDGIGDAADKCPDQAEDINGIADDDGCPDEGLVPTILRVVDGGGRPIAGSIVELSAGPETGSWIAANGWVGRAVPSGTYQASVSASGYLPVKQELVVPEADAHEVQITLEPEKALGQIIVRVVGPTGRAVSGADVRFVGTLGSPMKSGSDGLVEAKIAPGGYEITIAASGWRVESRQVQLEAGGLVDLTVLIRPDSVTIDTDEGQIYLHRKVFFELDKSELKVESFAVLDDLVEALLAHGEIAKLRIEGHTDTQGPEDYNLELSGKRAEAVRDYLIRSGVPPERLDAEGIGETRPLQEGESESVHATNRRVEFHIVQLEEAPQ